jgi:hypothetical protein
MVQDWIIVDTARGFRNPRSTPDAPMVGQLVQGWISIKQDI